MIIYIYIYIYIYAVATYRTPELDTSEIFAEFQWHLPMDFQRQFHCPVLCSKGLSLVQWIVIMIMIYIYIYILVYSICIYIYIYAYVHIYIYIYICVMYAYIYLYIYIYIWILIIHDITYNNRRRSAAPQTGTRPGRRPTRCRAAPFIWGVYYSPTMISNKTLNSQSKLEFHPAGKTFANRITCVSAIIVVNLKLFKSPYRPCPALSGSRWPRGERAGPEPPAGTSPRTKRGKKWNIYMYGVELCSLIEEFLLGLGSLCLLLMIP